MLHQETASVESKGTIDCISRYIELINDIQNKEVDKIIAYRGHYLANTYKLIPGIGRCSNYSIEMEKAIFYEFKKYSYSHLSCSKYLPKREMDWLFLAQHYGIPTRILDWTMNPLIALFFACDKVNETREGDGQVIIGLIEKTPLYQCRKNIDPFNSAKELSNQFIIPDYFDARLANQRSAFTISENPQKELNINRYTINVKKDSKEKILKEIDFLGIGVDFIYPTLDRLSERLKKQYNL